MLLLLRKAEPSIFLPINQLALTHFVGVPVLLCCDRQVLKWMCLLWLIEPPEGNVASARLHCNLFSLSDEIWIFEVWTLWSKHNTKNTTRLFWNNCVLNQFWRWKFRNDVMGVSSWVFSILSCLFWELGKDNFKKVWYNSVLFSYSALPFLFTDVLSWVIVSFLVFWATAVMKRNNERGKLTEIFMKQFM